MSRSVKDPMFLLRLDDACPTMDQKQWARFEELFDRYQKKPLVAVIPNNVDLSMRIDPPDPEFWEKVHGWIEKGWRIALHGNDHRYITKESGFLPLNRKSEFAGLPLEEQRTKIRQGYRTLLEHGITPDIWVAPSHSFDHNTLVALQEETPIRIISDGLARTPYTRFGFTWIPQQLWSGRRVGSGVWTICLHPNTTSDTAFEKLERFLEQNHSHVFSWHDLPPASREYGMQDRVFFHAFFFVQFLKKVYTWLRSVVVRQA
jgi:predicted deacetylase